MIRYDHAAVGIGTPEDDVAASLSIDDKSDPPKHLDKLLAGNVRRELH